MRAVRRCRSLRVGTSILMKEIAMNDLTMSEA
jgi:hypothetical protein